MAARKQPRPRSSRTTRQPPRKLTPELLEKICKLLRRGHYIKPACAYVGIDYSTYKTWRQRGEQARSKQDEGLPLTPAERPYLGFLLATDMARDFGEAWLLEQLLDTAAEVRAGKTRSQVWQAYMTVLERSRAERWQRRRQVDVGTPGDKPLTVLHRLDLSRLSEPEIEALSALIGRVLPDDG